MFVGKQRKKIEECFLFPLHYIKASYYTEADLVTSEMDNLETSSLYHNQDSSDAVVLQ